MKRRKAYSIYLLIDPETRLVRYVGNSKNPRGRLTQHIRESRARQNTAKKAWIYGLLTRNRAPEIRIVAQVFDPVEARRIESEKCHEHARTIFNIHDPAKGARDFKRMK